MLADSTPPSAATPFPLREGELVTMLALVQALHALAIDAMLPALGVMSRDLAVSDPNQRQLVIGMFLLGLGLGSLVPGVLADRFGRKPVLLASIGGYVILSLASALVTSIEALIAIRLVQGFVSSGLSVIPSAIIRDRFAGDRMARLQSLIGMIFMVVPMIAPSIGQAIMLVADWRWIFGLMALLGVVMAGWIALRLPETLHPEYRQNVHFRTIFINMSASLTDRGASGYVLGGALMLGAGWGYIQSSQQLVAEHFGAGTLFPVLFGGMALAMATANFTNSRIVERFGARRVSHAAMLTYLVLSVVHLGVALSGRETLWQFVVIQTLTMMMMGFVGANFGSISLQPFARIAGAASSAQAFVKLVLASLIGWAVGQSYNDTALPFLLALLASGLLTLALVLWSEKGVLFRRLTPPGAPRDVPLA
jgi:DHA1 family bicyclomycin/chloramphenicol resistance-like MFS transporter